MNNPLILAKQKNAMIFSDNGLSGLVKKRNLKAVESVNVSQCWIPASRKNAAPAKKQKINHMFFSAFVRKSVLYINKATNKTR